MRSERRWRAVFRIIVIVSGVNLYFTLITGGYSLSFGFFTLRSHSGVKAFLSFLLLSSVYFVWSYSPQRIFKFLRKQAFGLALLGIIALGLILRLTGIDHGLPHFIPIDETVMGKIIWDMVKTGAYNHRFISYPVLFYWLLIPFYIGYFLVGAFLGKWASFSQVPLHGLYIVGRVVTALISTATIYVGYLLGKKAYNRTVGLSAALFLSLFEYNVRVAKFMRIDVLQTFFLALALLYLVAMVKGEGKSAYFKAALFSGLAISSKYPSFIIIFVYIIAHLLVSREKRAEGKTFLLGVILVPLFSLLSNPFVLLDINRFLNEFIAQGLRAGKASADVLHIALLNDGGGSILPRSPLYGKLFVSTMGLPLVLMLVYGLILFLLRLERVGLLLSSFVFLYFLMIAGFPKGYPRYMLPLLPPVAVIASYGIFSLISQLKLKFLKKRRELVFYLLSILLILPVGVRVSRYSYLLTKEDTFELASRWIEKNIPEGSGIAGSQFMPELPRGRFRVAKSKGTVFVRPIKEYIREGYQYLVVTSLDLEGRFGERYQKLLKDFPKVKEFLPEKGRAIGPKIYLLRLVSEPERGLFLLSPLGGGRMNKLLIDIGRDDEPYLGAGWGMREKEGESDFRWSLGRESSLFFVVEDLAPLKLTLRVKPLLSARFPEKRVKVFLNKKMIATFTLKEEHFSSVSLSIPEKLVRKGVNELSFSSYPIFSPKEMWGRDDSRPLALAFDWVRIEKAPRGK